MKKKYIVYITLGNEDINKYINYIKNSFELTKINPMDLKNGLADSYYTK